MLIQPDARRPSSRQILATIPSRFRHTMLRLMPYGSLAPSEYKDLQTLVCWAVAKRRSPEERAEALASLCTLYDHDLLELPKRWQLIEEIAQKIWHTDRGFRVCEILFIARIDLADVYIDEDTVNGNVVGLPTLRGVSSALKPGGFRLNAALQVLSEAVKELTARPHGELVRLPEQERVAAIRLLRLFSVLGEHDVASEQQAAARLRFFRSSGRSVWNSLKKVPLLCAPQPGLYDADSINRIDHALRGDADPVVLPKKEEPSVASSDSAGPPSRPSARDAVPASAPRSSLMHVVIKGAFNVTTDRDERETLRRYEILRKPLPLAALPPLDQLAASQSQLEREFPWAANAIEAAFGQLRSRRQFGAVRLSFTPILLCGSPGTGKTRLARRMGEVLKLETMTLKLGGATDAMSILGTNRGWSTGQPSPLLRPLLQGTASALIVLDELDKPSNSTANSPPIESALLGLLENEDARHWRDGFLQVECDLTGLQFIATCNATTWMPGALKSRFRVLDVRSPTVQELRSVVPFVARDIEAEWGLEAGAFDGVPFDRLLPPKIDGLRQLRVAVNLAVRKWLEAPGQSVKH